MPKVTIDNKTFEVAEGRNLLEAALDNKLELPYFCWHPELGSVGACRLCSVKQYRDEEDKQGRLVTACMTPASDGTRISITDPEAAEFRRSVVEWLMINHPHDCPVCDEGGECHLQDMTVMTGHAHRRYRGRKRTYRNQYLGPFIHHEMNRCIQCYRCVRFYNEYAGGEDLGVFASRNRVYFGRFEEGALELPFAGNLVEVCPTGVFTDKTLHRHFTRKWDLQSAPSICSHCALGCNTLPAARYGTLRRVTSRYNSEVNGYWLCDRGRFGYEYVNGDERLLAPAADGDEANADDWESAIADIAQVVSTAYQKGSLAAVGSPRASLETNFVLREMVGAGRFSAGLADVERRIVTRFLELLRSTPARLASLRDANSVDAALVLGADVTAEAPLLDLALTQACRNAGCGLTLAGVRRGRLSKLAAGNLSLDPEQAAYFGMVVAATLRGNPEPHETLRESLPEGTYEVVGTAAASLAKAQRPLVITGTQAGHPGLLEAVIHVVQALISTSGGSKEPLISLALAEPNTLGAALLDGGEGLGLTELMAAIEAGEVSALVVCENDLFRRTDDPERLANALAKLDALVVLDQMETATVQSAGRILPVAAVTECSGTFVSSEGRAQRFFQVKAPVEGARASWRILRDILVAAELPRSHSASDWTATHQVTAALAAAHPCFQQTVEIAPPGDFRLLEQRIPRLSQRSSGRNAMPDMTDVRQSVRPPEDADTPFSFSMEGFEGRGPTSLLPRYWSPGWNSSEAINQFQIEVGGPLHGGDPGRRLLEPAITQPDNSETGQPAAGSAAWAIAATLPTGRLETVLMLCGIGEIFGSEETSRRAPAVAESMPPAYLLLNPDTAVSLGVVEDGTYRIRFGIDERDRELSLTVRIDETLPIHVAGLPSGYPETSWWQAPCWATVEIAGPGGQDRPKEPQP
jgi:NADH-quinone oxidoreductase subunit G